MKILNKKTSINQHEVFVPMPDGIAKMWVQEPKRDDTPKPRSLEAILDGYRSSTPAEQAIAREAWKAAEIDDKELALAARMHRNEAAFFPNLFEWLDNLVKNEGKQVSAWGVSTPPTLTEPTPNANEMRLPCGHPVRYDGASMTFFRRTIKEHPKLKELKCQTCGKPFDIKVLHL